MILSNSYIFYQEANSIIVKINSSGVVQWARELKIASGNVYPSSISVDNVGNFYICGSVYYFDTGFNLNHGYLCSFPTDGSKTGTYTDGAVTFTYASKSVTTASRTLVAGSLQNLAPQSFGGSSTLTYSNVSSSPTANLVNF